MLIPVNDELVKKLAETRQFKLDSEEAYSQLIEQVIHDFLAQPASPPSITSLAIEDGMATFDIISQRHKKTLDDLARI